MPTLDCRSRCGACCIAPSISSAIPGMPHGKPAGIPCVQLTDDYGCAIFGRPERPAVCVALRPAAAMCGSRRSQALATLARLETLTAPTPAARINLSPGALRDAPSRCILNGD